MLQGKNVIVTGARRGIGRATVDVCASYGANVWACARAQDSVFEQDMATVAGRYGVDIWPTYFDITQESEVRRAVKEIKGRRRNVDALANVAGIAGSKTTFPMTNQSNMHAVFDSNFFATTLLTQYVVRIMMRQNNGSIIFVSSVAGLDGIPAQYAYAASKAALIGGMKNLAKEMSAFNIRANAIAPGIIDTDMGAEIAESLRDEVLSRVAMKRMGKPEEVAQVIAFLASDLSSYMTAQVIRVDGGL